MSIYEQDTKAPPANREESIAGAAQRCFHCGDTVVGDSEFTVVIDGQRQHMCCAGCAAVAQTIVEAGLLEYYRLRTAAAQKAEHRVPAILEQAALYERPAMASLYSRAVGASDREASLILEGIECAACAWLVERTLAAQPGVVEAAVNFSSHRARVRWDSRQCTLGTLMASIARIGYRTQPYDPARREAALQTEGRTRLRRLGVAGLFGMQVMMAAVVLYAGDWWGIEAAFYTMFRWLSLVLSIPIMAYSAWPFFSAAARGLRYGSPGMDLPVALGLLIAFGAGVHATVRGDGHVYFDSVAMFTFLLLLARHLEFLARKRAQHITEALVSPVPEFARRIHRGSDNGQGVQRAPGTDSSTATNDYRNEHGDEIGEESIALIAVAELAPGDLVRVLPGESIPADGLISAGTGSVDESLLSGESRPARRKVGDEVHAGTINGGNALEICVQRIGADMLISRVLALVEHASETRPRLALLAERVARVFVLAVLLIAGAVALYWWSEEPTRWLSATIAVLVVTCPCALSLATPAAMTAAAGSLTGHGLVPARGLNIEALASIDHVVFDKTGTLTTGHYHVQNTHSFGRESALTLLRAAAALERHSEHPIARAIEKLAPGPALAASDVHNHPGRGISGVIDAHRWWLGAPLWVCEQAQVECPDLNAFQTRGATVVMIATNASATGAATLGVIELGDELREGARELVSALLARGIGVSMYSGDGDEAVRRIAVRLGIDDHAGGLRPQDKLHRLQALNAAGHTTAMIGDGINDAPVLASATVSIAMGGGAHAARASADFILVNEQLGAIIEALGIAWRARRVMRQNIAWALAYNLLALPIAAAGWVAPWMAALGMSCSSLVVVGNSLRLVPSSNAATRQRPKPAAMS